MPARLPSSPSRLPRGTRPATLALWRVSDPGNVGTLLRSADAFGAGVVNEEKPYGRFCLSLYEPGPPEKEEAFQISAPAGAGKTVRAYIDASDKCSVLVAAVTKDGKLVNGWRPQLSEVPAEFEEILLPKTPVKWDWSTASGPFDLYVLSQINAV